MNVSVRERSLKDLPRGCERWLMSAEAGVIHAGFAFVGASLLDFGKYERSELAALDVWSNGQLVAR